MIPAAQGLAALIETAFNRLLALDEASVERMRPLAGQSLSVKLHELPWTLTFAFSDRVDVLVDADNQADCHLALSLSTLPKLQDSAQLSQLIHQQALILNGDVRTAQLFSQLISELNIDLEEILSRYIGDVPAYRLSQSARQARKQLKTRWQTFTELAADAALTEKPIAVHRLAVTDFCDRVSELRADADRLEARLKQLEQRGQ
ncbi:hypothetical protein HMF8227_02802 [Saliniradius amylolyticus]|uniref:Ubiquinone biosynthesis accessory factor UbiJ n=1 Tax=Saliniradius amylolyticus TaxID=2183582 RepID=A0A2S2E6H9_9ALTE|nr:SCP2 sterol-binding domain-containing protein [Saliniradius amylolyticus]AWL13251.1 hypothetical protein HMF8227_02802 [Saliniradius amylolyticus]